MKIDVPFEIGDTVLAIDFCQHDGYYINCRPFRWSDIPNVGKTIFSNRKDAEKSLEEMRRKQQ